MLVTEPPPCKRVLFLAFLTVLGNRANHEIMVCPITRPVVFRVSYRANPLQALTVFCLFGRSRKPRSHAISNFSFRHFPLFHPTAILSVPFSIKFERIISFLLCRQPLNCRHDFCAFSLPNIVFNFELPKICFVHSSYTN